MTEQEAKIRNAEIRLWDELERRKVAGCAVEAGEVESAGWRGDLPYLLGGLLLIVATGVWLWSRLSN